MIDKLKDLAAKHLEAKEAYDKAIADYKTAQQYVVSERVSRYADVQIALVEVQFRLNMLQAHINDMVMARVREDVKEHLAEEFEAEQAAEHTDHEPLFNPESEG